QRDTLQREESWLEFDGTDGIATAREGNVQDTLHFPVEVDVEPIDESFTSDGYVGAKWVGITAQLTSNRYMVSVSATPNKIYQTSIFSPKRHKYKLFEEDGDLVQMMDSDTIGKQLYDVKQSARNSRLTFGNRYPQQDRSFKGKMHSVRVG